MKDNPVKFVYAQFKDLENKFLEEVASAAEPDLPVDIDDPYQKVSKKQKNIFSRDLTLFQIDLNAFKKKNSRRPQTLSQY